MKWTVISKRLAWSAGTVLSARDLAGCNIDALVQGGHLALSPKEQATPDRPQKMSRRMPVDPVPDETAEEPKE